MRGLGSRISFQYAVLVIIGIAGNIWYKDGASHPFARQ
jgi:hypothetical protein